MPIRGVPEPSAPGERASAPVRGRPSERRSLRAESGAERSRVWAPIGVRVIAVGVALLGLAGIGGAVQRARPRPAPALAHAGLGLESLSGEGWAALAVASAPGTAASSNGASDPAAASAPPAHLAAAGSPLGAVDAGSAEPISASNGTDPNPCPKAELGAARAVPSDAPASGAHVNLNLASAAELRALPGIGAKRAESIVALRQRLGHFRAPSDLLRIKGIGPRTLERLLPRVSVE
jgi:competence protein ComEA